MENKIDKEKAVRFNNFLAATGKTMTEISAIVGLSYDSLYKYSIGTRKPTEKNIALLRKVGFNSNYYFYGEGSPIIITETDSFPSNKEPEKEPFKIRMYPLPVNAGFGYSFDDLDGEHYQYVSYKYRDAKRFIAMRLSGDSMVNKDNPEYNIADGFSLIIDVSPTNICKHGDIVIVLINDVLYCKQFLEDSGKVIFHSFNPDYKDMKINGEYYTYKIIGKVVLFAKEL